MTGIYKITNVNNGKIYIGKSVHIETRQSTHFSQLRNNRHHNKYLQNSFNKYGEDSFTFEIIEECGETELSSKEEYYIATFDSMNPTKGFNLTQGGDGGLLGYKHSEETKRKIGEAQQGELNHMYGKEGYWKTHKIPQEMRENMSKSAKGKVLSDSTKQKLSIALTGEKNPFYGKAHSEEVLQKIKEVNTGENSYWYGRKHTDETKQKMSENNAKSKKVEFYDENGELQHSFDSIQQASDYFGVKYQTLASSISRKGKYKNFTVVKN